MKKYIGLVFLTILLCTACKDDLDCCVFPESSNVTLKFTHNWAGTAITSEDFNEFKFTTENGESVSIERLRYLISNITLNTQVKDYQLINIGENSGFEITFNEMEIGSLPLKFTFGFANKDNLDGIYQDLNSVSFNVPEMLGGGYHFMQFDGKYKNANNTDANFNYHAIRAVDNSDPNLLVFEDTSFEVDLGNIDITKTSTTIEIKMDISEWFKNPNTWNLNELNTVLMPNFEAQKLISANGKSVFSLGEISQ